MYVVLWSIPAVLIYFICQTPCVFFHSIPVSSLKNHSNLKSESPLYPKPK
jgi:hypothetical protein